MKPHIFRAFSIRGIADKELTDDVVFFIGRAIGTFFKAQGKVRLMVGYDVRNSSMRINQALSSGLVQTGISVINLGQVPTPVLNFMVDWHSADGGIMITASHNPPQDNGFKIRGDDHILHGDELQEIYRIIKTESFTPIFPSEKPNNNIVQMDPFPVYLAQVKVLAHQPLPFKVVIDGGNGTNGLIVSRLLRDLGCEVVELYCEPDGNFPNRNPDPTKPGTIADLSALVQAEKADLGIAYDGDGDRLVLVDENGSVVLGDQVLMILARDVLKRGSAKIAYEILCTQALADDVIAHGGEPVVTPSGYAFVHQAMQDTGAALGGEFSGHLFFNEPGFYFDDAILGTVKLLNILAQGRRRVSELVADLPSYYSSPQVRLSCPDILKSGIIEQVKDHFGKDYQVNSLDGAQIDFGDGWALVRQSNTQPVISMRFEAHSAERLEAIQATVQSFVEATINQAN